MSQIFLSESIFPPTREYSRAAELTKLHDDYFLERWPFDDEQQRSNFLCMDTAGFTTAAVPDGQFEKLVWVSRWMTWLFLFDDILETNSSMDSVAKRNMIVNMIPVAIGEKIPDPENPLEIILDDIWRHVQIYSSADEFAQMIRYTEDYRNAQMSPPCQDFNKWLKFRIMDGGVLLTFAFARWALGCCLTDAELNHPLILECEEIAGEISVLVNDISSYKKEQLSNSTENNCIVKLQDYGLSVSEEASMFQIRDMLAQKSRQLVEVCNAALSTPLVEGNRAMTQWIRAMLYIVSGNTWWSQRCGRYNIPGHPTPRMAIDIEGKGVIIPAHSWDGVPVDTRCY